MQHLLNLKPEELAAWLAERGLPGYRAAQIRRWPIQSPGIDFDGMSDLPKALRGQLAESFQLWTMSQVARQQSDDGTEKLLLEVAGGDRIECVLLRDQRGHRTVCLSTQVGCAMGCVFCASGLDGVRRNLTAGEILEQALRLKSLLAGGERLSHVVVMGMGEPLANLPACSPPWKRSRPARGWQSAPAGDDLDGWIAQGDSSTGRLGVQYHLAVSLHAPDDALRSQIVPAIATWELPRFSPRRTTISPTGRRVTFEYVLLAGVNDRQQHALRLAALLKGRPSLINLIPYNPVAGLPFQTPDPGRVRQFQETLEAGGLAVKTRYRKGNRIDAACGQLRRSRA